MNLHEAQAKIICVNASLMYSNHGYFNSNDNLSRMVANDVKKNNMLKDEYIAAWNVVYAFKCNPNAKADSFFILNVTKPVQKALPVYLAGFFQWWTSITEFEMFISNVTTDEYDITSFIVHFHLEDTVKVHDYFRHRGYVLNEQLSLLITYMVGE